MFKVLGFNSNLFNFGPPSLSKLNSNGWAGPKLDEINNSGLKCKTRENSNFLKKGKMIISVKIQNFYRYRMPKRTSPLESSREI